MNLIELSHLAKEVRWTLGGVLIALVVASISWRVLRSRHPAKDYSELRLRIRTWWAIVGLFGMAIVLNRHASLIFLAFVSFLALKEYLSLIPTRRADHRVLFLAYLAIPLQYLWIQWEWYGMFIVFVPVYMFLLLPTRMVMIGDTDGFLRAIGTLHWGLMTTVFSLSHAAMLIVIKPAVAGRFAPVWPSEVCTQYPGPGLLVLLVLLTQGNDVAQYIWGKTLGRRKVVPKVSPGKTIGGLLGGVATTILLATVLGPKLTFLDWPRAMIAGAVIGLGGFAGDVSISSTRPCSRASKNSTANRAKCRSRAPFRLSFRTERKRMSLPHCSLKR